MLSRLCIKIDMTIDHPTSKMAFLHADPSSYALAEVCKVCKINTSSLARMRDSMVVGWIIPTVG